MKQGIVTNDDVIVSNSRHFQALSHNRFCQSSRRLDAGISGDLLAMDICQSLFHLGELPERLPTDDLLRCIFVISVLESKPLQIICIFEFIIPPIYYEKHFLPS